ncbi:MAG: hypothetical protein HY877_05455 [Deltaproteobacteria bacterium]|nr:hypothetical protein [Deltaproteobacteria bacterium]
MEHQNKVRSPWSIVHSPQSMVRSPWSMVLCCLLLYTGLTQAAAPLSDLAMEQFEKGASRSASRNPFSPSEAPAEIDVANLSLEGLVTGENAGLGLVSGRIVRAEDKIGKYTVSKIKPGEIIFTADGGEQILKMEGFTPAFHHQKNQNYDIEFRHADLKDALNLLAKMAGYNLILPEDLGGRVNLSFADIPLRDAINSILKVNNYNYAIESGIMRVGKSDQFIGGTDLLATTVPLKFATAKDLVDKIKPLLSEKGSVSADERTNVLSIKDYDANVENARRFIKEVDRKDQQVLIEAQIVDASNDFARSLGVQWGVSGSPDRLTISGADSTGTFKINGFPPTPAIVNMGSANPTSGVGFRIGSLPGGTNIDLQLTAAEQKGDVNIISKPSVSTINNLPAKIRSGVTLYVKSTSNITIATTAGGGGGAVPSLQAIETGVQLTVTPQISPENHIKMTIDANESEVDFSKTVDGIPAIIDNTATTTVVLKDGETAVIGGLIKMKNTNIKKSVPGISKVPVIGLFFKSNTKTKTHTELMIFITPTIMR